MGIYSDKEEGWVELGENERESSTAKPINRKWDTEQEYNILQSTGKAGR